MVTPDLATRIRAHVPVELQALPQWVCWAWQDRAHPDTGELVRTKVPLDARTLYPARSTDSSSWTWLRIALRSWKLGDVAGVALALTPGLVGLDLDHCYDAASGQLTLFAANVVARIAAYTEISPGGDGLHILCRGTLPGPRRRAAVGAQAIELYPDRRFLACTGRVWRADGLPDRTAELAQLYAELFPAVAPGGSVAGAGTLPAAGPPLLTDKAILRLVSQARNASKFRALWRGDWAGYPSESEADLALCSILAFYTQDAAQLARLMDASGLCDHKWTCRPAYRAATIARALRAQGARFGERAA